MHENGRGRALECSEPRRRLASATTRRSIQWSPEAEIVMDDGEAIVAAAMAGMGIAQVPDYMASDALERGQLLEVLTERRPPPIPISIVYLHSRGMTPRLRALIDVLTANPT